ncbi:glycoside hydrolase family 113 [Portibacter marinus]|uniref:glycoside hydrolase family 113 n=1 Tax=Portibacter marinus TaxID=2898660 RepID=UPI001F17E2A1|nr:hypothetical protein [Portibacter marinus]
MDAENHSGIFQNLFQEDGKHRGMTVFHWNINRDTSLNQLIKNNIEWVAVVPFLYQETDTTEVMYTPDTMGVWGKRDSVFIDVINSIYERDMYVMLKPHLWMRKGWRSDIKHNSEQGWEDWFESYRCNLIHYAIMAEHTGVDMLCIGTELRSSILKQPKMWSSLIDEIREIYSGKLTYAANWDAEYADIPFWSEMDFIGIQAYYPLTSQPYPELHEIQAGWKKHLRMPESFSKKYQKPVLFTEIGYRSDHIATIEPWLWNSQLDSTSIQCTKTQNLAYEALFRELWHKEWFAGMFFWQWHNTSSDRHHHENRDFTPRFKPAENTIARWYGKSD